MKTKIETLRQNWSNKIRDVESLGRPTVLTKTRRFWKDKFHPYGWQVGFNVSVKWSDGQIARISLSDIGTRKDSAITNAMRGLGDVAAAHPDASAIYSELCDAQEKFGAAKAKFFKGVNSGNFVEPIKNSVDKLSHKFHAMRRNALAETHRPSRKICTKLAFEVSAGRVTFRDAVNQIIAAGGVQK